MWPRGQSPLEKFAQQANINKCPKGRAKILGFEDTNIFIYSFIYEHPEKAHNIAPHFLCSSSVPVPDI